MELVTSVIEKKEDEKVELKFEVSGIWHESTPISLCVFLSYTEADNLAHQILNITQNSGD